MWLGANLGPAILADHPSWQRVFLGLLLSAVPIGLFVVLLYRMTPRIWEANEETYAEHLRRALARRATEGLVRGQPDTVT